MSRVLSHRYTRELYAEEEFDCLQIEEHLSRHVTPRIEPETETPRPFFFSEYCPFPEQSLSVIKRFSSNVTTKNRDVPRETEICMYVRTNVEFISRFLIVM